MAETQPKLQPALLSLSAMISQYFTVATLSSFITVCGVGLFNSSCALTFCNPRKRFNLLLLLRRGRLQSFFSCAIVASCSLFLCVL